MTAGTENYGGRNECKPFFQNINQIVLGNSKFQLDPMSYTVTYEGKEISLAPRKFEVLYLFSPKTKFDYSKRRISIVRSGE